MTGFADGPPVRAGGALGDFVGGLYLALGVVAALLERERGGPRARARPLEPGRDLRGHRLRRDDLRRDRRAQPARRQPAPLHRALRRLRGARRLRRDRDGEQQALPPALRGDRAAGARRRRALPEPPRPAPRTAARSTRDRRGVGGRAHAATRCSPRSGPPGAQLPCARVAGPEELLGDPQLAARGHARAPSAPGARRDRAARQPAALLGRRAPRERALAPALGADNAAVYGELGLDAPALERLARDGIV